MINRASLIFLSSLAVLVAGFFLWNQYMASQLDDKLSAATVSVEDYRPEGTQGEAFDKMKSLTKEYPDFFQAQGFKPADFALRTDLEASAVDFKNDIEEKRTEIRDDISNNYLLTVGTRPKINAYIEKTDEKFTKDITNFAAFNPERVKLYETSVKYCESKPKDVKKFLTENSSTPQEQYHLALVLDNANTNLCPNLK